MPTGTKKRATAAAKASKVNDDVPAATDKHVERSASPNSTDTGLQLDQDQQKPRPMDSDQQPEPQQQQLPASASGSQADREGTPSSVGGSQGAGGLVSNTQPITEEEVQTFWAPEHVLLEEERLKKEREEQNCAAAAAASAQQAVLSSNRFAKLDALLTKAGAYSSFLSEQLQSTKLPSDAPAAADGAGPSTLEGSGASAGGAKGKGGKRKSSGKAAQAAKRQKKDGKEEGEPQKVGPTQELCPPVVGEMREYQLQGVRWLISLYQNGLNGILADQMGLGKTVQTIGFLSHLYAKGIKGPFMVVAPLSTLGNWVAEFKRWAPSIPVCMYHGSKADRAALRAQHLGREPTAVVCTSFEIAMADIRPLSAAVQRWKYLIVDEGHRLKNFECKLIRELRTLPVENRLLLTGTPLQNDLGELWSLLNFLQPDIFTSLADFEDWFDFTASLGAEGGDEQILAAEQRTKVVSKLHACLKPFLLRRVKADVEISLPRKQEILLYADMSEEQRKLNKQLLDKTLQEEMSKLAAHEGGSHAAVGKLNNVLMQMRKNCNHPDLITSAFTSDLDYPSPAEMVAACGKMALLERLMDRLKAGGHKVLIFSQMTKMLDLLESYLEQKGEKACRIDGSVPWQERQAAISSFNSDPTTWVFLLSTRAGGLGINLTAADTVIIYDSDWNPQQDLQAMDRCHRIGQTRPVQVFRLATGNSVEGRMLSRAAHKMALERLVIKKGVFKEVVDEHDSKPSSMSATELVELLRTDSSGSADKDVPQSGVVSDEMLGKLMDRTHLVEGSALPYPQHGVGYEVVAAQENSALLTGVQ